MIFFWRRNKPLNKHNWTSKRKAKREDTEDQEQKRIQVTINSPTQFSFPKNRKLVKGKQLQEEEVGDISYSELRRKNDKNTYKGMMMTSPFRHSRNSKDLYIPNILFSSHEFESTKR